MSKLKDLTGQKFGQLTALYKLHNYHKEGTYWLCICNCGNISESWSPQLRNGKIKSCGCLRIVNHSKKHGKANSRLYNIYNKMKSRCYNKNDPTYKYYGARGIKVCQDWLDNFQAFYDWAIENGYRSNLTIDRINVNGNYGPDNCRWITNKQQQRNKRNTKYVTYRGETKSLAEWCEILSLKYSRVFQRITKYNMPIEKAFDREDYD